MIRETQEEWADAKERNELHDAVRFVNGYTAAATVPLAGLRRLLDDVDALETERDELRETVADLKDRLHDVFAANVGTQTDIRAAADAMEHAGRREESDWLNILADDIQTD